MIDPLQDNDVGSTWNSSLESHKAEWHQYSFHVPNYQTSSHSELHIYLLEGGICKIDDVEISRNGGGNIIPNPGFESTTTPWLIGGTHIDSRRTTTDSHTGSACLEIVYSIFCGIMAQHPLKWQKERERELMSQPNKSDNSVS